MAELNRHVTQMIVASDDTRFTRQGGGDYLTTCTLYLKLTMIFFHTANQTVDSLHNDHSATFHNCIDLKTPVVGKMCTCNHSFITSTYKPKKKKKKKKKIQDRGASSRLLLE